MYKRQGLVWTDSSKNKIDDLSTDGLKGDGVQLIYLGNIADYLGMDVASEPSMGIYPINHSETMTAKALVGTKTLSLKNDAVLTLSLIHI